LTQLPNTQKLKQPPQWVESVWIFVHTPLQQALPGPQTMPQAPQLLGSLVKSAHAPPLQGGRPVPRQTQAEPLQNWPEGQQTLAGPHGIWPLAH
jgi:hypothetical protein